MQKTDNKLPNIRQMVRFWKIETLAEMVSLDRKLKMPQTCEKRLYKHITVVLCTKTARKKKKNSKYLKNETILKIAKMATMQKL